MVVVRSDGFPWPVYRLKKASPNDQDGHRALLSRGFALHEALRLPRARVYVAPMRPPEVGGGGGGGGGHARTDVSCATLASHSQWGEDQALLPLLLAASSGRPGRFVELGALDGLTFSNTLMLEDCFNFTGLLIEANPANYALARRNRPHVTVQHAAPLHVQRPARRLRH